MTARAAIQDRFRAEPQTMHSKLRYLAVAPLALLAVVVTAASASAATAIEYGLIA